MARKRMLDPSIWADEKFGNLSDQAKVLFIGIISHADDEGRLPGNPLFLTSNIFPYSGITKQKAELLLNEVLQSMKSVVLYEVDGIEYIQLSKWKTYQSINKANQSKYPPLREDYGSTTVVLPPNRIEKKRKENNIKEKKSTNLENYISFWNSKFGTKYKSNPKLQKNLDYWLQTYTMSEIKLAAVLGKEVDTWWSDKIDPTKLLRTTNQNKEPVDHIGSLLEKHKDKYDSK